MTKRTCLVASASAWAVLALMAGFGTVGNLSARSPAPQFSRTDRITDDSGHVEAKVYLAPAERSTSDDNAPDDIDLRGVPKQSSGLGMDVQTSFLQMPVDTQPTRKRSRDKDAFSLFGERDPAGKEDMEDDSGMPSFGWIADEVLKEERSKTSATAERDKIGTGAPKWYEGDILRRDNSPWDTLLESGGK